MATVEEFLQSQEKPKSVEEFLGESEKLPERLPVQQEESTSALGSFARAAGLGAPAQAVGLSVGGMAAEAAAPLGPIAAGGAGLIAGSAAAMGVQYLGMEGLKKLEESSPEAKKFLQSINADTETIQKGQQEHPWASTAGSIASGGPFAGLKSSVGQRVIGGAVTGGTDATQQAMGTGHVDPVQTAIATAGGAALGGNLNALGKKLPGVKSIPTSDLAVDPSKHVEQWSKTPEPERIQQAAFKDIDGSIIPSGKEHNAELKAKNIPQGFAVP